MMDFEHPVAEHGLHQVYFNISPIEMSLNRTRQLNAVVIYLTKGPQLD